MIIQFNTDSNITKNETYRSDLTASISEKLKKFSSHLTRIEVHLTDENGHKEGLNDKRCMLEARIEGRQPIAVTNHADTHEQAIEGALDKLSSSLETILGRLKNH